MDNNHEVSCMNYMQKRFEQLWIYSIHTQIPLKHGNALTVADSSWHEAPEIRTPTLGYKNTAKLKYADLQWDKNSCLQRHL